MADHLFSILLCERNEPRNSRLCDQPWCFRHWHSCFQRERNQGYELQSLLHKLRCTLSQVCVTTGGDLPKPVRTARQIPRANIILMRLSISDDSTSLPTNKIATTKITLTLRFIRLSTLSIVFVSNHPSNDTPQLSLIVSPKPNNFGLSRSIVYSTKVLSFLPNIISEKWKTWDNETTSTTKTKFAPEYNYNFNYLTWYRCLVKKEAGNTFRIFYRNRRS